MRGFLLLFNKFSLLGLFLLLEMDSRLDLLFFILAVSTHGSKLLSVGFLALRLLLHSKCLAALTLFILKFGLDDISRSPLGLFNLLPRLHFFLLKECNSIGEQLSVFLNAIGS